MILSAKAKRRLERLERDVELLNGAVNVSGHGDSWPIRHLQDDIKEIGKTLKAIIEHLNVTVVDVPELPKHKKLVKRK